MLLPVVDVEAGEWIQPLERQQVYEPSVHLLPLCTVPTVSPLRLCLQTAGYHSPEDTYCIRKCLKVSLGLRREE